MYIQEIRNQSVNTNTHGGSMGFVEVLTLVLVAAKLFGKLSWSWWYVFAPLAVTWAVVLSMIAAAAIVTVWAARR